MAKPNQRTLAICLLLGLVTLACYWQVSHHAFVNLDDHQYIYDNDHVKAGLSWDNIVWAFTTGFASNWHPLTWISHMLDCQLFGVRPGPQHLVNVLFHIADTVLLFLWLLQMTGETWRSAFVAAFFAWHPLHVESVAWASERKDVLSTLFWLLTLMAYVRYTRTLNRGVYYLTLFLFTLGLMAKPMVVTLPCVLLLLDFWPLDRMSEGGKFDFGTLKELFIEKLPFFALTVVACVVTYEAQQNAATSLDALPLRMRVANAAVAYTLYLGKAFWPVHLAAVYPYSKHLPVMWVIGGLALLASMTLVLLRQAKQRPYLLMGWLWFLGTLVPTIGLVQVGSQAMADRYMYIPSIGLFVAVIWLLAEWAGASSARRNGVAGLGVTALGCCLALTSAQLNCWQDGETLFRHAIAVTKDNYMAYDCLGGALDDQGRQQEALRCYQEAVRLEPQYSEAQYNLGTMLKNMGRLDEAAEHLEAAIKADPRFASAYVNLGSTLMKQGKVSQAGGEFIQALKLDRNSPMGFFNMGTWLLANGRMEEAVTAFNQAILLKPSYEDAHGNLGVTLMRLGRVEDGLDQLNEAVRLDPTNSQPHFNLGIALLSQGMTDEAVAQFGEALKLKPGQVGILSARAIALEKSHNTPGAIADYREALRVQPDNPATLNGLAWLLATEPDAKFRSGTEAVELATKACDLTEYKQPDMIETLAAAYAEAGRFTEALAAVQKAIELANSHRLHDLADKGSGMLTEFRAGRPYRATP